ncbi:hypothetical protein JCM21142_42060 [Saccharicrinis fermentans DSM 9555 = JCM 21142]|uniref:Uncharacterized protein n=1 Tax=Saccharicrinis fermentans DSM 9555 = JCM 21142 TaxID=869213 RepID=W7XXX9_9BACT|nr:hypothetical protein JCM21142_42060 [Saccharicrinis fermentans DSM 9555 = JCM 21142]
MGLNLIKRNCEVLILKYYKQGNKIKCPECESTDFYTGFKSMKGIKRILSTVISLALMVFPIYYKTVYKCKKCGNELKMKKKRIITQGNNVSKIIGEVV